MSCFRNKNGLCSKLDIVHLSLHVFPNSLRSAHFFATRYSYLSSSGLLSHYMESILLLRLPCTVVFKNVPTEYRLIYIALFVPQSVTRSLCQFCTWNQSPMVQLLVECIQIVIGLCSFSLQSFLTVWVEKVIGRWNHDEGAMSPGIRILRYLKQSVCPIVQLTSYGKTRS